jgi:hypothetical protein
MSVIRICICLILMFNMSALLGQDLPPSVEQCIEFVSEMKEEEQIDFTSFIDALVYFLEEPLDLNQASYEELQQFMFLSEFQIQDFLSHRIRFGKWISLLELQTIPSWNMQLIQLFLPFVTLVDRLDQPQLNFRTILKNGKGEFWMRYQQCLSPKKGFDSNLSSNPYLGARGSYFSKLKYAYRNNLSISFLGQSDAGEYFFNLKNRKGFDFYSAHLFYQGGKLLKTLVLGDYQIQFGQGLNCWLGQSMGKSSEVMMVKKSGLGLKPYQSIDEHSYLRGAALSFGVQSCKLLLFGSRKGVDASGINSERTQFSSLKTDGFHRTAKELEAKNQVTEMLFGGSFQYSKRKWACGIHSVYQSFNMEYQSLMKPYNQFDFRGNSFVSTSMDYRYSIRNWLFFGELAHSSYKHGIAQVHGLLVSLNPSASMSLVYRNYQRNYETFYNAGFSEGSNTQNEKGIYSGLSLQLSKSWSLNTYVDWFQFPWMRYLVDAPSEGHSFFVQSTYKPNKRLEVYARYRLLVKEKNSRDSDNTLTELETVYQQNCRLNLTFQVSEAIRFMSRVEYVGINRNSYKPEKGIMLYQDLCFKPKLGPLACTFRYTIFETDSYDSRIYAYESNALYVFSIPAYYYTGSKAYILLRLTCLKNMDLWVKYGTTIYQNKKTIGSGNEEIQQNKRTDLTFQLRWVF